jgi:hypothetical protein
VETFFYFLFTMMTFSFVAFILLNALPALKAEHSVNYKSAIIGTGSPTLHTTY